MLKKLLKIALALAFPTEAFGEVMIERSERPGLVVPFFEFKTVGVDLRRTDGEDPTTTTRSYSPNTQVHGGIRAYYDGFGMTLGGALPGSQDDEEIYGRTSYFDQGASYVGRNWLLSARYQRFKGFYRSDSKARNQDDDDAPRPQVPDMRLTNVEVEAGWVFQPEKFSLRSALDQTEYQRVSGGSWLAMLSAQRLAASDLEKADDNGPSAASVRGLGVLGGYGYNGIKGDYFMMLAMLVGPTFQETSFTFEDGDEARAGLGTKAYLRFAMGVSKETLVYGVSLEASNTTTEVRDFDFDYMTAPVTLFAGMRFGDGRAH